MINLKRNGGMCLQSHDDRNFELLVRRVRVVPLARTAEGKLCWLNPDTVYRVKHNQEKRS